MYNAQIRFSSKYGTLLDDLRYRILGPEYASIVSSRKGSILLNVTNTERAAELVFAASLDCTGYPGRTLLAWSIRLSRYRPPQPTTTNHNQPQ